MDSNSKHCPSRSADNLSKQPGCTEDQKDPKTLPTSCATSSTTEDRTAAQPADSAINDMADSIGDKTSIPKAEESVPGVKSPSIVSPQKGLDIVAASSTGNSADVGVKKENEESPNDRLSGVDTGGGSSLDTDANKVSSSTTLPSKPQPEAATQGTKRSRDDMEAEDSKVDSPVKQKNKKRCAKCNCKLELAQREIGRCRCNRVFCALHRLPELHGCEFDHKEDGRREAREKMVKPTRHLGTSFRRLDQSS